MAKKTVLYDQHVRLGARIVDFSGWELPVQYEGVLAEHLYCRRAAVAFDTSHMGQFLIQGRDAAEQLGRIGTQNAAALKEGACRYGFLLNEEGGVLDDTILMRLGEEEFLLVVNAGTLGNDWDWVRAHAKGGVQMTNLSAEGWGKIDLQGPQSFEALEKLAHTEGGLAFMNYFTVSRARCAGRECVISRTGYTGELGYEIMAPGEDLNAIFEKLLEGGVVKPAGLGARDSLRLEMCYPLYGHELTPAHNPLEAGLDVFIRFDHDFIGAKKLKQVAAQGPSRRLVAFIAGSRRRANPGDAILRAGAGESAGGNASQSAAGNTNQSAAQSAGGNEAIGVVTSGAFSPSLEQSIGMGYVRMDCAAPGMELIVNTGRAELPVTVSEKPLYKDGTCRVKNF
ncbi:MAG: glycine cleavage system aminomethyltransferase GcvT [Candidatus Sumerlaeota bacterium]|nr:glycine cleavage system aminomethyltransferase GcvT [Candidatus Sumerlaeota bacterium]